MLRDCERKRDNERVGPIHFKMVGLGCFSHRRGVGGPMDVVGVRGLGGCGRIRWLGSSWHVGELLGE